MNYVVVGAGAVGCYLGGRLVAAGHSVTFIGRPKVLTTLRQHGLTITDLDGFHAHLPGDQLQLADHLDANHFAHACTVLLCVKGGATRSAAQELAAVCPAHTTVISMQNGVENADRIRTEPPALAVVAGMVPFNVVLLPDGQVHRGTTGALTMARQPATRRDSRRHPTRRTAAACDSSRRGLSEPCRTCREPSGSPGDWRARELFCVLARLTGDPFFPFFPTIPIPARRQ